ncbi:hypothetical protein [Treponema phagedenis]|uniref:Factor H binding protein B domain-containing protein n=1 Tax=Treponema phagedenis TaxID=162 RepID=A0AAE6ISL4_TREPH|nr:hypothetical protein [Treponema phagedenis]QEJ95688.1 hypothetical protein FUT79_11050 [Treponema phagedenis]QEJ97582.1 hypothetical protein FUT82_05915 [Treponema phagedenis]
MITDRITVILIPVTAKSLPINKLLASLETLANFNDVPAEIVKMHVLLGSANLKAAKSKLKIVDKNEGKPIAKGTTKDALEKRFVLEERHDEQSNLLPNLPSDMNNEQIECYDKFITDLETAAELTDVLPIAVQTSVKVVAKQMEGIQGKTKYTIVDKKPGDSITKGTKKEALQQRFMIEKAKNSSNPVLPVLPNAMSNEQKIYYDTFIFSLATRAAITILPADTVKNMTKTAAEHMENISGTAKYTIKDKMPNMPVLQGTKKEALEKRFVAEKVK